MSPSIPLACTSGAWAFTPTLADGTYTVVATEASGSASLAFTLDTQPPPAPVISGDAVTATNQVVVAGTQTVLSTELSQGGFNTGTRD